MGFMAPVVSWATGTWLGKTVTSIALNVITTKLFSKKQKSSSPTYSLNSLQTQSSSKLVIPLVYGRVKLAGNEIWNSGEGETQQKIISFGFGKIAGFEDIRLNDILLQDSTSPSYAFQIQYTPTADFSPSGRYSYDSSKKIFYLKTGYLRRINNVYTFDCNNRNIGELIDWINKQQNFSATKLQDVKITDILNVGDKFCNEVQNVAINYLSGCNYTAYLGDGVQQIDSRVTGSTQEDKAKLTGGLKHNAYLAITAKASDKLSGNPNCTAIVKGRIVRIYTDTKTYTEAWSDNPAWCILDFLMNRNGCYIDESDIDIQSFIDASKICDEVVNGQKRFTLNLVLDENKSIQDWLTDMFACCRSYPTYSNGKHGIIIEKKEEVKQHFDVKLDEKFQINVAKLSEQIERVLIQYVDPNYEWTQVYALASLKEFRNLAPLDKTVEIDGVTNFQQASQLAWFYLNQCATCKLTATYTTNLKAINRTVGDVVTISDPLLNYVDKQWRIMGIGENQDKTIQLSLQEYNDNLYDDEMGSASPIINVCNVGNPFNVPPDVSDIVLNQNYYLQNDGTVVSQITGTCTLPDYFFYNSLYIEYSIDDGNTWNYATTSKDNNFILNNVKTNATYILKIKLKNKENKFSVGAISDSILITGKDTPPNAPTNIKVSNYYNEIYLSWDKVTDIDFNHYNIYENGKRIASTTDTQYSYKVSVSDKYDYVVKAVDNGNTESTNTTATSITIAVEPSDVNDFSATQLDTDRSQLYLSWSANPEKNIDYYIVKVNNTNDWKTGTVIQNLKALNYQYTLTQEGVFYFMIKAVNNGGFESINPVVIQKQIILKPSAPKQGTIIQDVNDRSYLKLSWDAVNEGDISKYVIYDANNKEIDRIADTSYRYKITKSGIYTFGIKCVNVAGYYSNALNLTITASIEPSDVTGFTASQSIYDHSKVTLYWNATNELDIAYHIIKKGNNWDDSIVIASRAYGTSYDVQVLEETEQKFWIKAVTIAGIESKFPAMVDNIYNLNPSVPTNLVINQDVNDRSNIIITWDRITEQDLDYYELRVGEVWETATTITKTKETKIIFNPSVSGDYKFIVKAKNNSNFYSDEVFTHFYVQLEPSNVTNFECFQNGESVEMSWDLSADADVVSYRIVEGSTYDNGTLVTEGITLTNYQVAVDTERIYTYHIKALNRSGHYSQQATTIQVTVSNLTPKNVILSYDEIALQNGTATNTEFGTSLINASNLGGKASDYPNTKCSEVGGQTVLKLKANGWTRNITNNPLCNNDSTGTDVTSQYTMPDNRFKQIWQFIKNGSASQYDGWEANYGLGGFVTGDTLTMEGWYKCDTGKSAGIPLTFDIVDNSQGKWVIMSSQAVNIIDDGEWHSFSVKLTFDRSMPSGTIIDYCWCYSATAGSLLITNPLLIKNKENMYPLTGEYLCQAKDVGQIITANIATLFYPTNNLISGGNAKLQYRTSRDNINWTNWNDFKPALCTFRYVDFKILFITNNSLTTPEVNKFIINIDVPDIQKIGTATIAVGGSTISYGNTFWTNPAVIAHAIGAGLHTEIIAVSKTNFVVKVLNNSGNDVGGNISWEAVGY